MKKYLVPLLVLVLLLVSVTSVFADRFSHAYRKNGTCTFDYQYITSGPFGPCETFLFGADPYGRLCMPDDITEKHTGLQITPIKDSVWQCRVIGTEYTDDPWCWFCVSIKEILLIEDITPPQQ